MARDAATTRDALRGQEVLQTIAWVNVTAAHDVVGTRCNSCDSVFPAAPSLGAGLFTFHEEYLAVDLVAQYIVGASNSEISWRGCPELAPK